MRAAYPRSEAPPARDAAAALAPDAELVELDDVPAVLAAVEDGEVDLGVVVLEDSVVGAWRTVTDHLVFGTSRLLVVGEHDVVVQGTDPRVTRRHVALGTRPVAPTRDGQTLLFVVPSFNRPGTLLELLAALSSRGINLTKVESRPLSGSLGMYGFLIEFEGSPTDEYVQEALADVIAAASVVKFLGTFAAGQRAWGQVVGRDVAGDLLTDVADVQALAERLAP